jgi:tetrapyrrole methylase family protein/MazG family protein
MITIVGLGPGATDHVTAETLAEIERHEHRFVRTTRHPSAHLVGDAVSFDDVYEAADRFEDVYAEIVDRLVAATAEHGDILYAVPGSPLVLERTVRALLADDRAECQLRPAMSFLDVAWARLGIDPVESRVRLVDGHEFADAARGEHGPMLVAHTHANWVLSDIKLAAEQAEGDEPVTILQALGTEHERVVETTWSELDRTVEADHLTCIYVPRLGRPVGDHYVRFHELTRTLREQCPWDREQTHQTLVPYLVEEAFELVDALQNQDPGDPSTDEHVIEELGDLLYHIEFHAAIAEQEGRFSIVDIADGVHDKLVRRHPHVFAPPGSERVDAEDADAVLKNWDEIKRHEKQRESIFDGVPTGQPALALAQQLQRKAAKVGFDWEDVGGPLEKTREELDELTEAIGERSIDAITEELGDLLFAVVNAARHLGVDAELALRSAATKFKTRFAGVEAFATERGIDIRAADLATLDALWDEVKAGERAKE